MGFAIALGCLLELGDKTPLLETPHVLAVGHRKVKNGKDLENPSLLASIHSAMHLPKDFMVSFLHQLNRISLLCIIHFQHLFINW